MHLIYLLSVYLHLLAAMVWIGGMLFLSLVIVPALRRWDDPVLAARLMGDAGRRFRTVGWIAVAILVLTGVVNALGRWGGAALVETGFWASQPGQLLAIKLAVVTAMVAMSVVHDFALGPRLTAARRAGLAAPEIAVLRRRVSWLARANVLLGLAVVALAVALVRGLP